MLDSGAAKSVANEELAPEVKVEESKESRRGQNFIAAIWKKVPNRGPNVLNVWTEEGRNTMATFQMTDVRKPLTAVGDVYDKNAFVVLGKRGGFI